MRPVIFVVPIQPATRSFSRVVGATVGIRIWGRLALGK
jgi:hypothetical protein